MEGKNIFVGFLSIHFSGETITAFGLHLRYHHITLDKTHIDDSNCVIVYKTVFFAMTMLVKFCVCLFLVVVSVTQ